MTNSNAMSLGYGQNMLQSDKPFDKIIFQKCKNPTTNQEIIKWNDKEFDSVWSQRRVKDHISQLKLSKLLLSVIFVI